MGSCLAKESYPGGMNYGQANVGGESCPGGMNYCNTNTRQQARGKDILDQGGMNYGSAGLGGHRAGGMAYGAG